MGPNENQRPKTTTTEKNKGISLGGKEEYRYCMGNLGNFVFWSCTFLRSTILKLWFPMSLPFFHYSLVIPVDWVDPAGQIVHTGERGEQVVGLDRGFSPDLPQVHCVVGDSKFEQWAGLPVWSWPFGCSGRAERGCVLLWSGALANDRVWHLALFHQGVH